MRALGDWPCSSEGEEEERVKTLTGINLRKALRLATDLGCTLRNPKATGDILITHPLLKKPIRVSGHRKDCPRVLSTALTRLLRTPAEQRRAVKRRTASRRSNAVALVTSLEE